MSDGELKDATTPEAKMEQNLTTAVPHLHPEGYLTGGLLTASAYLTRHLISHHGISAELPNWGTSEVALVDMHRDLHGQGSQIVDHEQVTSPAYLAGHLVKTHGFSAGAISVATPKELIGFHETEHYGTEPVMSQQRPAGKPGITAHMHSPLYLEGIDFASGMTMTYEAIADHLRTEHDGSWPDGSMTTAELIRDHQSMHRRREEEKKPTKMEEWQEEAARVRWPDHDHVFTYAGSGVLVETSHPKHPEYEKCIDFQRALNSANFHHRYQNLPDGTEHPYHHGVSCFEYEGARRPAVHVGRIISADADPPFMRHLEWFEPKMPADKMRHLKSDHGMNFDHGRIYSDGELNELHRAEHDQSEQPHRLSGQAGEQPMPMVRDGKTIVDMVREDLYARMAKGVATYGTPLRPFNGRSALIDAYEEALDLACYLRQQVAEDESWAELLRTARFLMHQASDAMPDNSHRDSWMIVAQQWNADLEAKGKR